MKRINQIKEWIKEITSEVEEGDVSPFLVGREFDTITDLLEASRVVIQKEAKEECKNYTTQELERMNIKNVSGGATYNYSANPEIMLLNEKINQLKEQAKQFRNGIINQANKSEKTYIPVEESAIIDEETGEITYSQYMNTETGEVCTPAKKNQSKGYVTYKKFKG